MNVKIFTVFLYIMVLFFTLWSFSLHCCPFLYIMVLFFKLWSFSFNYGSLFTLWPFFTLLSFSLHYSHFLHYGPFLYIMVLFFILWSFYFHYGPFTLWSFSYIMVQFLQNVLLILVWIKPLGKMRFFGVNYTGILTFLR